MKLIIFLDIDGVLNHEAVTKDCDDALRVFAGDMPKGGFDLLCPRCIERLNALIRIAAGMKHWDEVDVVCSSTWRRYFEPRELTKMLLIAGFDFEVVARTEINDNRRGVQIINYMVGEKNADFLVLDDDTYDMGLVEEHQIVMDFRTGFDNSKLNEAIKHLEQKAFCNQDDG